MNNFSNLKKTLSVFRSGSDFSYDQLLYFVDYNMSKKYTHLEALKEELNEALLDETLDWIGLAEECKLFRYTKLYSNSEIIHYMKRLLWDYLYPEKQLLDHQIILLSQQASNILKKQRNEGWKPADILLNLLKMELNFKDLEYYQLWKIDFTQYSIERKLEHMYKDATIGYLRYNDLIEPYRLPVLQKRKKPRW